MSKYTMKSVKTLLSLCLVLWGGSVTASDYSDNAQAIYDDQLKDLYLWFHQNPELSMM